MRSVFVVAVLAAALFAGCADGNSTDATPTPTFVLPVQATSTTGVIRGVVYDDAIRPVPNATVTISALSLSTTTNEFGNFAFEDLEPATYFLSVKKPGFATIQTTSDVVAGVNEPELVRVQIMADGSVQAPRFEVLQYDGFLECSITAVVYFVPCDGIGNDVWQAQWNVEGNFSWIHMSMVWEATQAVGTELYFNLLTSAGYNGPWHYGGGKSPIGYDVDQEADLDEDDKPDLSEWSNDEVAIEVAGNGEAGTGVGVILQQKYYVYVVLFQGFTPPEGYSFHEHGDPIPPDQ